MQKEIKKIKIASQSNATAGLSTGLMRAISNGGGGDGLMRAISGGGDGFLRGFSGQGEDLKALADQSIKEQELRQDVDLLKKQMQKVTSGGTTSSNQAVAVTSAPTQDDKQVKLLEDRTKKGFLKVKGDLDKFKQEMKSYISGENGKLEKRLDADSKTLISLQKLIDEVKDGKPDAEESKASQDELK